MEEEEKEQEEEEEDEHEDEEEEEEKEEKEEENGTNLVDKNYISTVESSFERSLNETKSSPVPNKTPPEISLLKYVKKRWIENSFVILTLHYFLTCSCIYLYGR